MAISKCAACNAAQSQMLESAVKPVRSLHIAAIENRLQRMSDVAKSLLEQGMWTRRRSGSLKVMVILFVSLVIEPF